MTFALGSVPRRLWRDPVDVEGRDIRPVVLRLLLGLMLLGAIALAVEYIVVGRPWLMLWLLPYALPAACALVALRRWSYTRVARPVLYYFLVLTVGLRLFCEPTYAIDFINLPIYSAAAFYLLTPRAALAYSALMFVGLLAASLVVYLFHPLPILYSQATNPNAVWISSIASGLVFSAVAFQLSRESVARLRRLHDARAALDSLNEDYRNLIRVVIHDFANEIWKAQLALADEPGGREAVAAVANISELVAHLRRLEESAGVRDERKLAPFPIDLLLERVRLSFRTQLRRRRLQLVIEAESDVLVLTEPVVLCIHVVGNLVSNAIKYSVSPGEVGIRVVANDATVRISVSNLATEDDPTALRERLEGKRAAGPSERGQGIGLAIVRRFCDVLGYPLEVRVDANGRVAVVMTVTVPRVAVATSEPALEAERPSVS